MRINDTEVTLDDLQNGYYIFQAADGFRFGADAVLLSDFAQIRQGEKTLDLGTGSGIIPILLAAKTKGEHFYGLEIQGLCVEIAKRSVEYNGLEERISIVEGDIKNASEIFGTGCMDVVVSNPPYMTAKHGRRSAEYSKYIARHEVLCTFEDVAREASRVLRDHGRAYIIHRPFRLTELMLTLTAHALEPKRLRFVHSRADKEPSVVMIEALKGANRGLRVDKPLIIDHCQNTIQNIIDNC